MDLGELAGRFPSLWHVTFSGGAQRILDEGLKPASVALAELGRGHEASAFRGAITPITGTGATKVTLRDQKVSRKDPGPCLDGITPEEWWTVVNSRSYLFCRARDTERLVASYLGRGYDQEVLTFDTAGLLARCAGSVEVTTVNAGVFPRKTGVTRGRWTFVPLAEFDAHLGSKIKEVTVTSEIEVPPSAVRGRTMRRAGEVGVTPSS
jgi:hypothetical protein